MNRSLPAPLIRHAWVVALWLTLSASVAWAAPREDFPEPDEIKPAVSFWMRVYLEVTTDGGLLHDNEHLGVVYEALRFEGRTGRAKERFKDERRRHWEGVLRRLARQPTPRDESEAKVLEAFERSLKRKPTARDLRQAIDRIRFQLGQRDKFRAGLIRSGAYEAAMRDVFRRAGLPEDLAYLPHVESSFNTRAYSKYGAAGAWQFMPSTGRQYMTVDYVVDERLDPMTATRAAARLLGENYQALESWPLALTAYNHGRGGMLRAKQQFGADIAKIIQRYKGRTFGFASRNFYAQFLAARKIMHNYESYFGAIEREEPEPIEEVELPFYADIDDLQRYLGVTPQMLESYNPALRPPVFRANKRIPKGYVLRLPAGTIDSNGSAWLASIPAERQFAEQHRSKYYKVQRGDTLSAIARRNGTQVRTLASLNNISKNHRIFAGQVLQLPDSERKAPRRESPSFELIASANAGTLAPAIPEPKSDKVKQMAAAEVAIPAPKPEPEAAAAAPVLAAAQPEVPEVAPAAPVAKPSAPAATAVSTDAVALAEPSPELATLPVVAPQPKPELPFDSPFREVKNDTITVDAAETLGHYAEWLEIPAAKLRKLNRLSYRQDIRVGQRIKLDFSKVSHDAFVQRRTEYHKGIEEDFFGSYQVVGVVEHRIKPGDTIWKISKRTYDVPTWLIHRYNPEANLSRLTPGGKLVIPQIEPLSNG